MLAPRDESNIMASLCEAASEIAPYTTCAEHRDTHTVTSYRSPADEHAT